MWCGGMLETGIGRAHNIHLATMPGFVYPGDTASASRTYAPRHRRAAARGDRRHHARAGRARHRRHARPARSSTRSPRACDVLRRLSCRTLEFRELRTAAELAVLPAFEQRIWGGESAMRVGQHARRHDQRRRDGDRRVRRRSASSARCTASPTREPHVLHSHYMAVDPDVPAAGLGVRAEAASADVVPGPGHRRTCAGRSTRCSSATRTSTCTCSARSGVSYHVDHYGHARWHQRLAAVRPGHGVVGARTGIAEAAADGVRRRPPVTADDIAASSNAALHGAPVRARRARPASGHGLDHRRHRPRHPPLPPRPHLTGRLVHSNVRSVPVLRPPPPWWSAWGANGAIPGLARSRIGCVGIDATP